MGPVFGTKFGIKMGTILDTPFGLGFAQPGITKPSNHSIALPIRDRLSNEWGALHEMTMILSSRTIPTSPKYDDHNYVFQLKARRAPNRQPSL